MLCNYKMEIIYNSCVMDAEYYSMKNVVTAAARNDITAAIGFVVFCWQETYCRRSLNSSWYRSQYNSSYVLV